MNSIKNFFSGMLGRQLYKRGYVMLPLEDFKLQGRAGNNFGNLCRAYEERLREGGCPMPACKRRPELLARQMGTPPSEAYSIVEGLSRTSLIEGDVCEFGVAQGETSALIASEILETKKRLHLFDSFEGLPPPTAKDALKDDIFSLGSIEAYTGRMANPETLVRGRLGAVAFPESRVQIHRGFFEDLAAARADFPTRVSFAYVDFDFYAPVKLALGFLDEVTSAGAIVIVDDYDYFSTGVKSAVDEFLNERRSAGRDYELHVPNTVYGHYAVLKRNK